MLSIDLHSLDNILFYLLLQGATATRWLHKDATNLLLLLQFKHFHTHPFEALKFFFTHGLHHQLIVSTPWAYFISIHAYY
jgi:hypothetical protein